MFSMLDKPTNWCNGRCDYCYNETLFNKYKNNKRTDRDTKKLVAYAADMASKRNESVRWLFHGGEPTSMGKRYFELVLNEQSKYNMAWKNSVLTNGSYLDEDYIKFFADNFIELGVSYDFLGGHRKGLDIDIKFISDTWFKYSGERLGIINVVTPDTAGSLINIVREAQEVGLGSIAFNPVFEGGFDDITKSTDYTPMYTGYSRYLRQYFSDKTIELSERYASEMVAIIFGNGNITCRWIDCRGSWVAILPDLKVATCDRTTTEFSDCGSVEMDKDPTETEGYKNYCDKVQKRLDTTCKDCGYLSMCGGGCFATHALSETGLFEPDCILTRTSLNTTYNFFRDFDIHCEDINPNIFNYFKTHRVFTLNEIYGALHSVGYTRALLHDEDNLPKSLEYMLFRVINPKISGEKMETASLNRNERIHIVRDIILNTPEVASILNLNDALSQIGGGNVRIL